MTLHHAEQFAKSSVFVPAHRISEHQKGFFPPWVSTIVDLDHVTVDVANNYIVPIAVSVGCCREVIAGPCKRIVPPIS